MRKTRRFTEPEDEFIKANIGRLTCTDIAKRLGRNPASIVSRATTLGLRKANRKVRRFTEEDDKFIRDNAGKISLQEISKRLGRSTGSVWGRGQRLGVWFNKKTRNPSGRKLKQNGYVVVRLKSGEWRAEHIVIIEKILGRRLRNGEAIHHINFNKSDNRPENLHLCSDGVVHNWAHTSLFKLVGELLERGIIAFNTSSGEYELCETSK